MKKCPKCGTILDDSKKKCYMCGADLMKKNPMNFLDSFDDNVGAAVSKSQDNVFNGVPNISVKVDEIVNEKSDNVTFSTGSSSANFFQEQMGSKLNTPLNDGDTVKNMFSNDTRFNNDPGINAQDAMKKNESQNNNPFFGDNIFGSGNVNSAPPMMPSVSQNNDFSNNGIPNNVPIVNTTPTNDKPAINWGNNLVNSDTKKVKKYKDKVSNKFNLNISFIFNTVCFVLFLGAMIFVYFKFIKPKQDSSVQLGGLNYVLPEKFIVSTDDNFSKFYKYGDGCSMRVSYNNVTDTNSAIDTYYQEVQNTYANIEGLNLQKNTLNIDGNSWTEISVLELKEDPAGVGGYSTKVKYRFVTIVYNAEFYEIKYVNNDNDNTCSAMYNELINSLSFD